MVLPAASCTPLTLNLNTSRRWRRGRGQPRDPGPLSLPNINATIRQEPKTEPGGVRSLNPHCGRAVGVLGLQRGLRAQGGRGPPGARHFQRGASPRYSYSKQHVDTYNDTLPHQYNQQ